MSGPPQWRPHQGRAAPVAPAFYSAKYRQCLGLLGLALAMMALYVLLGENFLFFCNLQFISFDTYLCNFLVILKYFFYRKNSNKTFFCVGISSLLSYASPWFLSFYFNYQRNPVMRTKGKVIQKTKVTILLTKRGSDTVIPVQSILQSCIKYFIVVTHLTPT